MNSKTDASPWRRHALAARWAALLWSAIAGMHTAAAAAFSDIDYRLGDGLHIPGTGLTLGGYATARYDRPANTPGSAALDNLSMSIWWESEGRWKFFAEFDSENTLGSGDVDSGKPYVSLERMYLDYALNDTTSIRAGKFLTPIGRWNLVHATPLVWTTSRPLTTSDVFPTNATGLMVNGRLHTAGHDLEYSVYASNGSELHPNPALDTFSKVFGAHLNVPTLSGVQLGLSYATFEQKQSEGEHKQLVGMDFLWTRNRYEVSAEGVYRFSGKGSAWDERGAFVQAVAPLSARLYAIGRYESYRTALQPAATQQWIVGLNCRITQAVVLKAEWISTQNNRIGAPNNRIGAPGGFTSSVSVLF